MSASFGANVVLCGGGYKDIACRVKSFAPRGFTMQGVRFGGSSIGLLLEAVIHTMRREISRWSSLTQRTNKPYSSHSTQFPVWGVTVESRVSLAGNPHGPNIGGA
jgi:hypothetical protein